MSKSLIDIRINLDLDTKKATVDMSLTEDNFPLLVMSDTNKSIQKDIWKSLATDIRKIIDKKLGGKQKDQKV